VTSHRRWCVTALCCCFVDTDFVGAAIRRYIGGTEALLKQQVARHYCYNYCVVKLLLLQLLPEKPAKHRLR
jgi:hypothetical protein